ncbi:hypothetical protein F2S72_09030 [Pseudomonas syringae pv. actinidiae]|nr:hypothetical protein [Pseudomonas syringae pv. actinidiae]
MSIQAHHRDRARIIAQHEIGHLVISKCMGFTTGGVSVKLIGFDGHQGGAEIMLEEPFISVQQVKSYLERRAIVLFAGAVSETLPPAHGPVRGVNKEKASELIHGQTALSDYGKAREAIAMLRNILHPETVEIGEASDQKHQIIDRLWDRSVELVGQFETTIVGVAGALVERLKPLDRERYEAVMTVEELDRIPALLAIPLLRP